MDARGWRACASAGERRLGLGAVRQPGLEGLDGERFEATSPACAPPMPSATTNSGERTSSESSLARRWRPVSLPEYCSATRSI